MISCRISLKPICFFLFFHSFLFILNIKAKVCTLCFNLSNMALPRLLLPSGGVYALNRHLVKLLRYFVSVLQRRACCVLSMSRLNKISLNSLLTSFMNITQSFFKASNLKHATEGKNV